MLDLPRIGHDDDDKYDVKNDGSSAMKTRLECYYRETTFHDIYTP
jgi:hypothetical protein